MFLVPSCAILLWMSRRSCSVTQNSMRIGLVRSAIGYSPPSNYNGHFKRKTWYPLRKKSLSLYNGHFLRQLAGRARVIFLNRIPLLLYNGQYFMDWGGISKKIFSLYNGHFLREKQGSALKK